jgi:hypothetical protein
VLKRCLERFRDTGRYAEEENYDYVTSAIDSDIHCDGNALWTAQNGQQMKKL